jgi:hypothetical protein
MSPAYVTEDKHNRFYIEGNLLIDDKVNLNNRRYSSDLLSESVADVSDRIRQKSLFGHLGHVGPNNDPTRVSHVIESLTQKGSNWWGRARVISEGGGKILQSILRAGGAIGMSSAGLGSVKKSKDGIFSILLPSSKWP